MNIKTFLIIFILLFLQSCALTYETSWGGDDDTSKEKENGTSNK